MQILALTMPAGGFTLPAGVVGVVGGVCSSSHSGGKQDNLFSLSPAAEDSQLNNPAARSASLPASVGRACVLAVGRGACDTGALLAAYVCGLAYVN